MLSIIGMKARFAFSSLRFDEEISPIHFLALRQTQVDCIVSIHVLDRPQASTASASNVSKPNVKATKSITAECPAHLYSRATKCTFIFHSPSLMRQPISQPFGEILFKLTAAASTQAGSQSARPPTRLPQSRPHASTFLRVRRHRNRAFPSALSFSSQPQASPPRRL